MKRYIRSACCFFSLLFLINPVFSQNWEWSRQFGGTGNEAIGALEVDALGNYVMGGSFSENFQMGNTNLATIGNSDVFLAKLDEQGNALWAVSGGSANIDATISIKVDSDGNIYWLGEYWIEGFFGTDTLYSAPASKAVFLLKYDPDGNQIWSRRITGTASKTINDLAIDAQQNIFLTGYFTDTLLVQDTFLFASGVEQLTLLKFSPEGDFVWGKHFGEAGTVRGRRILLDHNGEIIVGGHFLGTVTFGDQQLESVSTDFDLLVVKFDASGNPLWAKAAKGILEDICNALALDAAGHIYLSGSFIGEMDLGDGIEISTPGFDDNLFLLKYDAAGNPVWARGLGNEVFNELSVALDIAVKEQSVLMTGYFRDELMIDPFTIFSASDGLNGFLAAFSTADAGVEWLRRAPCSGQLLSSQVALDPQGEVSIAGTFLETAFFDDNELLSHGINDVFLSRFDLLSTAIQENEHASEGFMVFPNPTCGFLFLKTDHTDFTIKIYDLLGREVLVGENNKSLDLTTLSPGNYWLCIENATFVKTIPFTKL